MTWCVQGKKTIDTSFCKHIMQIQCLTVFSEDSYGALDSEDDASTLLYNKLTSSSNISGIWRDMQRWDSSCSSLWRSSLASWLSISTFWCNFNNWTLELAFRVSAILISSARRATMCSFSLISCLHFICSNQPEREKKFRLLTAYTGIHHINIYSSIRILSIESNQSIIHANYCNTSLLVKHPSKCQLHLIINCIWSSIIKLCRSSWKL